MTLNIKCVLATFCLFFVLNAYAEMDDQQENDDIIVVNPDDKIQTDSDSPQSAEQAATTSDPATDPATSDETSSSSPSPHSAPTAPTVFTETFEPMPDVPSSDPNPETHSSRGSELAVKVHMYEATPAGQGKLLGDIGIMQTEYGLVLKPDLKDIRAGLHGFHIHENPSCKPMIHNGAPAAAMAAGEHYNPDKSHHHRGPWKDGHLGDLPVLFADDKGRVETPVLAPRLKMTDVHLRTLVIHEEGDNYSDQPKRLGGGGARIACGVIR